MLSVVSTIEKSTGQLLSFRFFLFAFYFNHYPFRRFICCKEYSVDSHFFHVSQTVPRLKGVQNSVIFQSIAKIFSSIFF